MWLLDSWARLLLPACLVVCGPLLAVAQVKTPAPLEKYDVQIRYRIVGDRNERVLLFEEMVRSFAKAGFVENPGDDNDLAAFDPDADTMIGTAPSKSVRAVLNDRRLQTVLLLPAGFKTADPQARVQVQLELAPNREPLLLANQVELALKDLGFVRDVGFDTKGSSLLKGNIPAGNLTKLLKDLRKQPAGWFLAEPPLKLMATLPDGTPAPRLASPLADAVPVRLVEVIGVAEPPPAIVTLPPIPADQPYLAKLTPDLRRQLAVEGAMDKPLRLEVVLANAPSDTDYDWREQFFKAGVVIEGRVGAVVTVTAAKGSQSAVLASAEDTVAVRLPRLSSVTITEYTPPKKAEPKEEKKEPEKKELPVSTGPEIGTLPPAALDDDPLKMTRLDLIHNAKRKGRGTRIVIIDSDFAGWTQYFPPPKKDDVLPLVRLIDLTAERNRDIRPDATKGEFGHGTHCALAARHAAPDAELLLVRVPADAPYQLINIARYIRGDVFVPEGIQSRRLETEADVQALRNRRERAKDDYRRAFDNFDDDEPARQKRIAAQKALVDIAAEQEGLLARLGRLNKLEADLIGLKNSPIVLCLLTWNTGFALDAASPMSRFLDDWLVQPKGSGYTRHLTRPNPIPPPMWFQPAGDTRGQTWTGTFRDADGNGAMEFASADAKLLPGRWSRELNFLAVRAGEQEVLDLPGGAKIRVSVQWREPHDPELPENLYRAPVAPLRLQLVKQRDPSGIKAASDEVDVIAQSEGLPERLQKEPHYGIYEHSLEVTLPAGGRYALRIEGKVPTTNRPANVPTTEGQAIRWELRPRVFVESVDGNGRYQLADYATPSGGVAVPADARSVLAVGACDKDRKPRSFGSSGAGPLTDLVKPDILAPDSMPKFADEAPGRSSALAASFTAGWAATVMSAGIPADAFTRLWKELPHRFLEIPEAWFRK